MKRATRAQVAWLRQLLSEAAVGSGVVIRLEVSPLASNGHVSSHAKNTCAWPGCHKRVTGVRCRKHAQLVRSQEARLHPGRFRETHQRAPMASGSYDACECGRPKLASESECDVCRELNKHRQAPGRSAGPSIR